MENNNFGDFINKKRIEKNISLRALALKIGISTTYLSDIEDGRRTGLSNEYLQKLVEALELNDQEKTFLYDLASKKNNTIPLDVTNLIKENDEIIAFLRQVNRGEHEGWLQNLKNDEKK